MAGHSQFKNIMYRKGAQDAKRAKEFTKLGREIQVSAKLGGGDPESNPRLRAAIAAAKKASMPKDNIERAIKKATGGDDSGDYHELRYEGYAPGGVAIIVEALTDNKNRTASDVRAVFSKHGGSMGETNSVAFMFRQVGEVVYDVSVADHESMFEAALEAGAEDCVTDETSHVITTAPDDFSAVRDALEQRFDQPERSGLVWQPSTTAPVDEERAQGVFKLIDALEDHDDVQKVFANFEISDEVMERLTA
ncbi:MAG: YebC/PmpR family DNA-binding transcriptional regulator [Azospirillaceae bacterium]